MPPKRTRRSSPAAAGLSAGDRLKRAKLAGNSTYSAWGWVGTEVSDASEITQDHRLATCGFSKNGPHPLCLNKYAAKPTSSEAEETEKPTQRVPVKGELEDDVIVISDDETPSCDAKSCKGNPFCLNHLGQEKWENEDKAREAFLKVQDLGENPLFHSRDHTLPVGLKNLGATCYANAFLQVWYQDLPFRDGVYKCQPSHDKEHAFEESPIFQLQVTFAAMQEGTQSAFNPIKLVESLHLSTTEQQDAQEFSKLFMAHLDSEFQKQSNPALKSLIADQFQGKQAYGTVCENCGHRSERESDFLEIEVNIQNNSTLEDRIAAMLQPEVLTGDNKYRCPQCDSLQDAKRYTELRQLPPVLHFSLLRFVYDLASMERKKSKHAISFPTSIDMDQFMGSADARKSHKRKHSRSGGNKYELRGVLLHKGPSAYHGHYEAQIFDVQNQAWYQFNDEQVTKIKSLGGKKGSQDVTPPEGEKLKQGGNARKKRRVETDSDIEILAPPPQSQSNSKSSSPEIASHVSSKDAYMLIYSRVGGNSTPTSTANGHAEHSGATNGHRVQSADEPTPAPMPPPRAAEAVKALNAAHKKACEDHAEKDAEAQTRFSDIRRKVRDIYQTWNLSSRDEPSVVASRQALESWITRHLRTRAAVPSDPAELSEKAAGKAKATDDGTSPFSIGNAVHQISLAEIVCNHGLLNPEKVQDMKVIREVAYHRILSEDSCELAPKLTQADVCDACVKDMFIERLYQIEHPRQVARFDEISLIADDEPGYWISKPWVKDWRLAKPKMHTIGQPDPPPDTPEYQRHVLCEHGGLSTNTTSRRRISEEGYLLLRHLFPSWEAVPTSTELCAVCEALVHISKEDKREIRRQAEEEKAKLKHMHDNALTGSTALLEDVPCAILPAHFVRMWRHWLLRPGEAPRPDGIDNSQFVCEHGELCIDPNCANDLDSSVAIVKRSDWDILENLYPGGPLIAVENRGGTLEHDLPVCDECRRRRSSTFDITDITIRILGPKDPIPTADSYSEESFQDRPRPLHQSSLLTYGSRKAGGLRQSTRIRQVKALGKRRRVTVTKDMSVKDLKILVSEECDIPTISQRLFYRGQELEGSAATIESLGIMSNDIVDLREESEDVTLLSDTDVEYAASGRKEGLGFGGTLLAGRHDSSESLDTNAPSILIAPDSKACSACTFENVVSALACSMCDTPFACNTY
ncbi:cysteine proteinase [Obba rivulosa]|uniref:ubiquitinyl hydrolase 1 n=1 Tax=Obba rivulosa TaxID=1052685 RepID=A0A8E2DML9_9APHY|nr:cysteine proteinase [Obba rivulosa]